MGGWPKTIGGTGGRWAVMDSQKWWEVGDWSDKQVEDGRLASKQVGDGRL